AKGIQDAILPPDEFIEEYLPDSFVLFKPKDVVSGDFYWMEKKDSKLFFAAVDCTGHGVPGAFVSMVGANGLHRCLKEHRLTEPAKILDKLTELVEETFRQRKDGMDIALCALEMKNGKGKLDYAGANNSLYFIRNGELHETKPDKQPIGAYDHRQSFTNHTTELQKDDTIYVFSDGYPDQFGGPKGKKFKYRKLRELLLSIQDKTMNEQKEILDHTIEDWMGDEHEQIDDICIIGVRI
ncbi:SpoIIE family protein phosphatase, partial [Bacteroidales bacterium AH-315-I05]|nr:SpoIIE family protein phosphatase [Bacteroidales bacterium AH-315-I05]